MPDWDSAIRRCLAPARLAGADERAIADELRQHLDDRYEDLLARGLDRAAAEREALRELGEGEVLGALVGRAHPPHRPPPVPGCASDDRPMRGLLTDVRIGARLLRRSPGFTAAAVITLALGVGANTTVFSIVNALLFRPLPGVVGPSRILQIGSTRDGEGFGTFSLLEYADYAAASRTFSGIAAHYPAPVHVGIGENSERLRAGVVSGNYFAVLGAQTPLGRPIVPEDDGGPGARPVAVLTHRLWQSRFGGDRALVGRQIRINAHSYTVIGIAAENFAGTEVGTPVDLFVPIAMVGQLRPGFASAFAARDAAWLRLFGRLAPGATDEQAEAELELIARRLALHYPAPGAPRGAATGGELGFDPATRAELRTVTRILLGVVVLILLIACANVANLLLARGTARAREMAVRTSLGATRGRLVRQIVVESALLAALGGAAGVALGAALARLAVKLPLVGTTAPSLDVGPDWRVFAFGAALAAVSIVLFGLPAALRGTRLDLVSLLKSGTPGGGNVRPSLQRALLAGQLALSLVLLVGAGLFARSLGAIYRSRPGFETRTVLLATADVALQGYDEPRGRQYYDALERGARAIPGVRAAGLAYMLPLGAGAWEDRAYRADAAGSGGDEGLAVDINVVSPGWLSSVGLPLLSGRNFSAHDRGGGEGVAIVNEVFARSMWGRADALGLRFRLGQSEELLEVVGVTRSARYRSLLELPRPVVLRPFGQVYQAPMTLHVRTDGDPAALVPAIRRLGESLDRALPLHRVQSMAERLDVSVAAHRTGASLVAGAGALALLLAALGLYASMTFLVTSRTREIGIRMALGASGSAVLGSVLREAARVTLIGSALGLVFALPATRLLRARLYGVGPTDPAAIIAAALILAVVTLFAAWHPAYRATRIEPTIALRRE